MKSLPAGKERREGFCSYLPLISVIILMVGPKAFPGIFPDPRLPLTFVLGSALALLAGRKFNLLESAARRGVGNFACCRNSRGCGNVDPDHDTDRNSRQYCS